MTLLAIIVVYILFQCFSLNTKEQVKDIVRGIVLTYMDLLYFYWVLMEFYESGHELEYTRFTGIKYSIFIVLCCLDLLLY
jgi:hypothetical protein